MMEIRQHPLGAGRALAVAFAAQLRQVLAGGDAQPRAQALHHHARQAGQQHHKQQVVAVARAGLDRRGPVARVHVADGNQQAGAGKHQHSFEKRRLGVDDDRASHFRRAKRSGSDFRQAEFHAVSQANTLDKPVAYQSDATVRITVSRGRSNASTTCTTRSISWFNASRSMRWRITPITSTAKVVIE